MFSRVIYSHFICSLELSPLTEIPTACRPCPCRGPCEPHIHSILGSALHLPSSTFNRTPHTLRFPSSALSSWTPLSWVFLLPRWLDLPTSLRVLAPQPLAVGAPKLGDQPPFLNQHSFSLSSRDFQFQLLDTVGITDQSSIFISSLGPFQTKCELPTQSHVCILHKTARILIDLWKYNLHIIKFTHCKYTIQ